MCMCVCFCNSALESECVVSFVMSMFDSVCPRNCFLECVFVCLSEGSCLFLCLCVIRVYLIHDKKTPSIFLGVDSDLHRLLKLQNLDFVFDLHRTNGCTDPRIRCSLSPDFPIRYTHVSDNSRGCCILS